jgi:hypothetical protein
LPIDLLDWPHGFGVSFAGVGFSDFISQFIFESGEDGGYVAEASGGLFGFGIPAVNGHGEGWIEEEIDAVSW